MRTSSPAGCAKACNTFYAISISRLLPLPLVPSIRFALKGSLLLTVLVAAAYILLFQPLILLFNSNPVIVDYGRRLPISQVALYPAFGLCYMMTITFQTIGESRYACSCP